MLPRHPHLSSPASSRWYLCPLFRSTRRHYCTAGPVCVALLSAPRCPLEKCITRCISVMGRSYLYPPARLLHALVHAVCVQEVCPRNAAACLLPRPRGMMIPFASPRLKRWRDCSNHWSHLAVEVFEIIEFIGGFELNYVYVFQVNYQESKKTVNYSIKYWHFGTWYFFNSF